VNFNGEQCELLRFGGTRRYASHLLQRRRRTGCSESAEEEFHAAETLAGLGAVVTPLSR
jgi:hypothetical protein